MNSVYHEHNFQMVDGDGMGAVGEEYGISLGWITTWYRTVQWTYAIILVFGCVNLFYSLNKAHGKLMWTIIFFLVGATLYALNFWFTIMSVRASVWFNQLGMFGMAFSIILLA